VVRDVTDIDHPSTVATLDWPADGWGYDGFEAPSFVSAATISYGAEYGKRLVRVPLSGVSPQVVAHACGFGIITFAWSPDGHSFTYVSEDDDLSNPGHAFEWHLVIGGVDRVIGSATAWCHCGAGFEDQSLAVRFSPNGQFVSLVNNHWLGTNLQVRRLDSSLVGTEARGDRNATNRVTMGVWSGTDLFFRDSQGVQRWREGAVKPFLPGVAWLHPWASPAGEQIVYAMRGPDGFSHVNVVDTSNGQTRQLSSQPRAWPIFLTQRYIWYRGERTCTPTDPMCRTTTLSGKTYIYDLQTGTEWESIISTISDVWPHGG
jgi:hypothetical protein